MMVRERPDINPAPIGDDSSSMEKLPGSLVPGTATDVPARHQEMCDELADVLVYCIYLADELGVSIPEAISAKVDKNALKYPVEKARGSSRKYTEL